MLDKAGDALVEGMGLKKPQVRLLIRVGWVLLVSGHIAWVCGWLVLFGLRVPFANAADVDELKANARLTLQLQLQQELRVQKNAWCSVADEKVRDGIMIRIDQLRNNLREVAKIDDGYGEPRCNHSP